MLRPCLKKDAILGHVASRGDRNPRAPNKDLGAGHVNGLAIGTQFADHEHFSHSDVAATARLLRVRCSRWYWARSLAAWRYTSGTSRRFAATRNGRPSGHGGHRPGGTNRALSTRPGLLTGSGFPRGDRRYGRCDPQTSVRLVRIATTGRTDSLARHHSRHA